MKTPTYPAAASPPSDPPTATALKLYVVITRAAAALHAHARADIASHGLTETEFAILEALYHKGGLLLGEVQREALVSSGGANLRLNSSTGQIAAVDVGLLIGTSAPFVDAVAYTNNTANAGTGTTTLYDMDARNDSLYIQNPPNNGTLNLVGPWGVSIDGNAPVHFDILTPPGACAASTRSSSACRRRFPRRPTLRRLRARNSRG